MINITWNVRLFYTIQILSSNDYTDDNDTLHLDAYIYVLWFE